MNLTCVECDKEYESNDLYSYFCSEKCEKIHDEKFEKFLNEIDAKFKGDGK